MSKRSIFRYFKGLIIGFAIRDMIDHPNANGPVQRALDRQLSGEGVRTPALKDRSGPI